LKVIEEVGRKVTGEGVSQSGFPAEGTSDRPRIIV
jgi:hypothetical protein